MRKETIITLWYILALVGIFSCSNKKQNMEILQKVKPGMFIGKLPCADCPGIETSVTINPDSTIVMTSLYLDSNGASFIQYGKWSIKDSLIVGTFDSEKLYYLPQSDTVIALVDKNGKESVSMPGKYQLKRVPQLTSDYFQGEYIQSGLENEGYKQFLVIEKTSDDQVLIKITFSGQKKGCTFTGNGEIINNQIIVDLNKVNPDLKSTMIIHSTGTGTLNISTSDNYKDSIPFCADDGNLAGNYQKITSQNQY